MLFRSTTQTTTTTTISLIHRRLSTIVPSIPTSTINNSGQGRLTYLPTTASTSIIGRPILTIPSSMRRLCFPQSTRMKGQVIISFASRLLLSSLPTISMRKQSRLPKFTRVCCIFNVFNAIDHSRVTMIDYAPQIQYEQQHQDMSAQYAHNGCYPVFYGSLACVVLTPSFSIPKR